MLKLLSRDDKGVANMAITALERRYGFIMDMMVERRRAWLAVWCWQR